jgi:hypothetical protein
MNVKTSLKYKSGEIITGHINPESVFRRAPVLANSRLYASLHPCTELVPCHLRCKLSTKGQNPATKELGKHHFRTAADRYDVKKLGKNSIKSAERERRTKVTAHTKVFQVIESRNIPHWKKFLSVKENNQALIEEHSS